MSRRPVPRPQGPELLVNLMLGPDVGAATLPPAPQDGVRGALERVLVEALSRPPCLVSFSGGRDSSAVLALATAAARRHALPEPVAATLRFPAAAGSHESSWQRAVLRHLGLAGHEVVELGDELDALGPLATDVLRRHGLLWPGNAYMHRPLLALARGGTLLTGIGGDELLSTSAPRRSARAWAVGTLPRSVRAAAWRARHAPAGYRWLTAVGRRHVARALAREEVASPYRWDAALRHWVRGRGFAALDGSLRVIAEPHDVRVINPLLDPQVLAALEQAGGRRGFPGRTAAMSWLCQDLLPREVISRATKAEFGGAVWGPGVRELAAGGPDRFAGLADATAGAVDPVGFCAELSREQPDFRTILLLQQAWLDAQPVSASRS